MLTLSLAAIFDLMPPKNLVAKFTILPCLNQKSPPIRLKFNFQSKLVCKIPLLARAPGLAAARPSARATIGYLVYKI